MQRRGHYRKAEALSSRRAAHERKVNDDVDDALGANVSATTKTLMSEVGARA